MCAGAYVDLKDTKVKQPLANLSSGTENVQSDAVFATIGEYVKANPKDVKKVNAVFLYHILVKGNLTKSWSKYSYI